MATFTNHHAKIPGWSPSRFRIWQAQKMYWDMLKSRTTGNQSRCKEEYDLSGEGKAVRTLGHLLYFNVEAALAAKGDI
jgi:hypothetical protein